MAKDPGDITILLVEDAAVMRKIELKTLRALGYHALVEAVDGRAAVETLEQRRDIDLVISDWNMPRMSGLELVTWIRAHPDLAGLPFLMATGQGDREQAARARAAGVTSFVAKPFNQQELAGKIAEALDGGAAAAVAPAAAPRLRTGPDGRLHLRLAHIQITDHLVLGVLKHLIAAGEIVPAHFELETCCMGGWNPVGEALEAAAVDGACILAPIAMDLFRHGIPLRLVLLAHKNGSICVRNSAGRFAPPHEAFFSGKTFFIPHKLSVHHMLAHQFFQGLGLRPGLAGEGDPDVTFEVVPPVKMQEFLESGADAGGFMVAEPLGTRAIAAGSAHQQFLSGQIWTNHPCCVVTLRQEVIDDHPEAVHELVAALVRAGQVIRRKPETAAEIGVAFLDPDGRLGLKAPILKRVLTEPGGIDTGDLLPDLDALDRLQTYMAGRMGIGERIDLARFVDLRFAHRALGGRRTPLAPARLCADPAALQRILVPDEDASGGRGKSMLALEGKYLLFSVGGQRYGLDILQIREIIGQQPIRPLPESPLHIPGVIRLRDRVLPVIDLRTCLGLPAGDPDQRRCIIVTEICRADGAPQTVGCLVDAVATVSDVRAGQLEPLPPLGPAGGGRLFRGVARLQEGIHLLLDMAGVLGDGFAALPRAA